MFIGYLCSYLGGHTAVCYIWYGMICYGYVRVPLSEKSKALFCGTDCMDREFRGTGLYPNSLERLDFDDANLS